MAEEKASADDLEQLRYLYNVYSQKYELLLNEITSLTLAQNALNKNLELLDKTDTVKNSNVLIHGEGGTYFEAKVGDVKNVLTYVGANYMVEKSVSDAKDFLEKNRKLEQDAINKLNVEKQKTEKDLMDLAYSIESFRQE